MRRMWSREAGDGERPRVSRSSTANDVPDTPIRSDPVRTTGRIRELEAYVRRRLLADGEFICRHFQQCQASRPEFFYEGQMSHVGRHYDLTVDGRELRIVVVGQEYGQRSTLVDLKARAAMINGSAETRFGKRNAHMAGTTSILRLLLGREVGTDRYGETLFRHRFQGGHIFDAFALVNYLLCTALPGPPKGDNAGKGASSREMQRNCGEHFRKALEILEPTVIIAEGQGVRSWIGSPLALGEKPSARYDGPVVPEATHIAGQRVDVLTFNHPSAPGQSGWWGKSPRSKYLKRVVEPTIVQWRRRVWG